MDAYESAFAETRTRIALRPPRSWFFAKLSAVIGFVVGGCVVLYLGLRTPHPPPALPGEAFCGNSVLGEVVRRWIATLLQAPLGAIACSLGAAFLGGILDCVLHRLRLAQLEWKRTINALIRLLDDPSPRVRKDALEALEWFAPRGVPESAIARLLNDSDESVRQAAQRAQKDLHARKE